MKNSLALPIIFNWIFFAWGQHENLSDYCYIAGRDDSVCIPPALSHRGGRALYLFSPFADRRKAQPGQNATRVRIKSCRWLDGHSVDRRAGISVPDGYRSAINCISPVNTGDWRPPTRV